MSIRNSTLCCVVIFVASLIGCGETASSLDLTKEEAHSVAEDISEGRTSQPDLIALDLSASSKELVAVEFGKVQNLKVEGNIDSVVKTLFTEPAKAATTSDGQKEVGENFANCTEKVVQVSGTNGQVKVSSIRKPAVNECGTDNNDKILVFSNLKPSASTRTPTWLPNEPPLAFCAKC